MTDQVSWGPAGELRQALFELQRYLSDKVAPLMVADSVELLLGHHAQLAAAEIQAWVTAQYRGARAATPVSDFLFHAFKKIHDLGEFKLVPKERLVAYLTELEQLLLPMCPAEDRELLETNLHSLGLVESALAAPVEILHRQAGGATPPMASPGAAPRQGPGPLRSTGRPAASAGEVVSLTESVTRGLRRFAFLMDRLERIPQRKRAPAGPAPAGDGGAAGVAVAAAVAGAGSGAAAGAPGLPGPPGAAIPADGELSRQLLTLAALTARTSGELNGALTRLQSMGLDTRPDRILDTLGRSLPGWGVLLPERSEGAGAAGGGPTGAASGGVTAPGAPVEALHQFVVLAEDRAESARRFHQLVQTAIEQFNEGSLAPAITLLDLAERIIAERKVDEPVVHALRQNGHRSLDPGRLRSYAERQDRHALLRKALIFFEGTRNEALLAELWDERKRDRRHLLLALLEVHGEVAREAALSRLENSPPVMDEVAERYYQRNLIVLLRRIPRPAAERPERELDLFIERTASGTSVIVMREAILALGQTKHPRAEQVLIARLGEFEEMALKVRASPYTAEDIQVLLDRTTSALARFGSPAAWSAVVEHGLKRQPAFGDATARLVDLGTQDLSAERDLVARLVRALRAEMPTKVFGLVLRKRNEPAQHLVRAVAGTNVSAVHQAFEEILQRYPNADFAEPASKALAVFDAPPRLAEQAAAILSGDLDLFGLPNLLQSLSDSQVSGQLVLSGREGSAVGTLVLEEGRVRSCHAGGLSGEEAIFRLFEKPSPGIFVMKRSPAAAGHADGEPFEVLPLILEGMRRHDEYQQARALVPDEAQLRATGTKPTRPDDETDQAFLKTLWTLAIAGTPASEVESTIPADPYRIRRVLAHWVEEGALAPRKGV